MWNNSSVGMPDVAQNKNSTSLVTDDVQRALGVVLAVMLGLLVFSLGCSVQVEKIWYHMRHPWGILVGLFCQFGVMPLTAYLLAWGFSVTPVQAVAIIILGSCPGGTISNFLTYWLDGDMDLSITMTSMSTLLGMGTMPLCLYIYTGSWIQTRHIKIPFLDIGITSVSLIVPVSFGILVSYKWPKVAKIILKVGSFLGGLIMAIVGVTSLVLSEGIWDTDSSVIIIGSILPIMGYTAGFLIAVLTQQPWNRCRTIAMETGAQNVQLCGTMLQLFFPWEQFIAVASLPFMHSLFQLFCGLLLIIVFRIYKRISYKKDLGTFVIENPGCQRVNCPQGEVNRAFESDSSCKPVEDTPKI